MATSSAGGDLNKFRSMAIVTTNAKVQIVERLKSYWHMKSLMIQMRSNPDLIRDPAFQHQTMQYVREHTELINTPFWTKLTAEAQLKACQYLVMQEVTQPNYIRLEPNKDKAAVYIVLSGTAEIKTGLSQEEVVLNPGEIFGNVPLFDEAVRIPNQFNVDDLPHQLTTINHSVTATLHKGTFMRLGLKDFHTNVLKNAEEEEKRMQEEAVEISGIAWEDLTEDDKFYIRVYKRTRTLINYDLFAFLDAYKLVPKNARTPAYKYYREGIFGRELHLDPDEALHIYVIIDGGIRIEIEARRDDPEHNVHALTCERKGKKPMVVMTRTMPILLLESGALLFPSTQCYLVGMKERAAEQLHKEQQHHLELDAVVEDDAHTVDTQSTLPSLPGHMLPAKIHGHTQSSGSLKKLPAGPYISRGQRQMQAADDASVQSQATHSIAKFSEDFQTYKKKYGQRQRTGTRTSRVGGGSIGGAGAGPPPPVGLYRLKAIFERETTYLKIPFTHFERILDDERLIVRSMADVIKRQLQRASETILRRITSLLPWLLGKSFTVAPVLQEKADEDDALNVAAASKGKSNRSKTDAGGDEEEGEETPTIGGELLGSYGTNVLNRLQVHSANSLSLQSLDSTSRAGTSAGGGSPARRGQTRRTQSDRLLQSLKSELAAKQRAPVFLTAAVSEKGRHAEEDGHARRRKKKEGSQKHHPHRHPSKDLIPDQLVSIIEQQQQQHQHQGTGGQGSKARSSMGQRGSLTLPSLPERSEASL